MKEPICIRAFVTCEDLVRERPQDNLAQWVIGILAGIGVGFGILWMVR